MPFQSNHDGSLAMALIKVSLVERLVSDLHWDPKAAAGFVDQLFETMKDTLASSEEIKLSGMGKFEVREKRKRPGRNPKTLEEFTIEARRVVVFKPSPKLKDQVAQLAG
jgi:integration host factor subunit alpha